MANELWIEELKHAAWAAQMKEGFVGGIDAQQLLKLIEMATKAPPVDALAQCQEREESLKEELDELESDNFDLRHENEFLAQRIEQLEEESERNLRA